MPSFSVDQLAQHVNGYVVGHCPEEITSIAALGSADKGQLSFIVSRAHLKTLMSTRASCVIISKELESESPVPALVVDHPEMAYAQIALLFAPLSTQVAPGISHHAVVATSASIDATAKIGPRCVIGENVVIGSNAILHPGVIIGDRCQIGEDCQIHSQVSLYHDVCLGDRVIIHSGAVLGADGFGHVLDSKGQWQPIPQLGGVVIGDDVSIGANTTIDRGAIDDTVIESGVKLDNQIQIGHNVRIGEHTAVAGCTGIAGSVTIGQHCMIGGACGIGGHLSITDNVVLTAMSGVTNSIKKPGIYSSGTGLFENLHWRKTVARLHQLNDWVKRIKQLERLHNDNNGQ